MKHYILKLKSNGKYLHRFTVSEDLSKAKVWTDISKLKGVDEKFYTIVEVQVVYGPNFKPLIVDVIRDVTKFEMMQDAKQDEPTKPALPSKPQRHYVIKDKASRMYLGRDITKHVRELPNAKVFTESELDKEGLSKHLEYIEVKTVKVDGFGFVATRLADNPFTIDCKPLEPQIVDFVDKNFDEIVYFPDVSIVESAQEEPKQCKCNECKCGKYE